MPLIISEQSTAHLPTRALELHAIVLEMKSSMTPDVKRIEKLRIDIDKALDAEMISVRDWRVLVEECSKIRRAPRC